MNITCTWTFHLHSDAPRHVIADAVDAVMGELLALEDASAGDSAIGLNLERMSVEISVTTFGLEYEDAVPRALAMIRTAIHASGGSTAGWVTNAGEPRPGLRFEPGTVVAA